MMSCAHLEAEVASLQHKGRRRVLATPCRAGPNDGLMQPRHKVPKVVGTCVWYAAVKPLFSCKVIQAADELDGHLQ